MENSLSIEQKMIKLLLKVGKILKNIENYKKYNAAWINKIPHPHGKISKENLAILNLRQ